MDLRAWCIPADDEILVLQGLPINLVLAREAMALRQSREDPRLPQHGGVAVRRQRRPGDESDVEQALGDPRKVLARGALDDLDRDLRVCSR